MALNTPINVYKLNREAKKFIDECDRLSSFSINKIYVPEKIFDCLIESISPTIRSNYSDSIPFKGKILARK